ncbi:MAG: alpha/beta fold hydrolase [Planctomycetota bacterium]|nr:MAG: alpha/beta fold hydrolase [Planctomycetota bacterium]
MHYVDEGAGEPLLFVHGNPTWSFAFRHLIRSLRSHYRVVAVDHVGCGLSDKPRRYEYTLRQHRDNLVALIDALDLHQATLIGHDWGGCIGTAAVLCRPDRFRRLVYMNTAAFVADRLPWRIAVCRWPLIGPLLVRGLNGFSRAALRMAVADRRSLTPAARCGYLAPYSCWADRIAIQRFVEDIPVSPRHPSRRLLEEIQQGLSTLRDRPTLLVWGMKDWCFTPAFLRRFVDVFPDADVVEVPEAGHWVFEDAPEATLSAIRTFLDACGASVPSRRPV